MKLSTLTAKLTETKAVRALAITAVAGVALMMATPAAQAQVSWGIQVGTPVYVDPAPTVVYQQGYYNNGYYDGDRYAAWRAHEAHEQWERHEAWERQQAWLRHEQHEREEEHEAWHRAHDNPYGYGNGYGYGYYQRRHHDDDDR